MDMEFQGRRSRIADMMFPVRCLRCHTGIYDTAKVTVTARYSDCSVWKTPCCGQTVDDRGETGWTLRKDYERIDKDAGADPIFDMYGRTLGGQW